MTQDPYGYVPLEPLMRYNRDRSGPWLRNQVSVLDFYHVIEHNSRFELWGASDQGGPYSVRCMQEHNSTRLGLRLGQAYFCVWGPNEIPPMLIHWAKFENLELIELEGIRPFERPIHMISRRYSELVERGEVSGRLAKVDCLLFTSSRRVCERTGTVSVG